MIGKRASLTFTNISTLVKDQLDNGRMTRTASGRVLIEPGSDKEQIVEAEVKKHPNALFFRAKAIEANCPNSNGDYFSEEELQKSYKSFEGVPFFTNHDNQNVENARGKVIFAEWIPEEKSVYTICFIDRDAYPHICRSVEEEYVTGVSMGSVSGESKIAMADGTEKIIKDVLPGECVFSPFGNKCKVLKTYSANLHKPMYKIVSEDYNCKTLFSEDHPVYVSHKTDKDGFGEPTFVEIQDIDLSNGEYFIHIPLLYDGIRNNLENINYTGKIIKVDGQIFYIAKINSINKVEFDALSYDLKVEGDESYIADGIAVHNCSVEYSVCNICGNKAEKTEDYCSHIRNRKGRKFTGSARNVTNGETRNFKDQQVFEYNFGLKFIELSAVVDPACPTCHIEGIIPNEGFLCKVAKMENEFRMIRSAALEKQASQEELDQVDKCLQNLEKIAISLIQNRKQVEMEFSSDLVKIMSDLQTWLDELIGAGYGNVQGAEVPGTAGNVEEGAVPPQGAQPAPGGMPPSPMGGAQPMPAASESGAPVGKISGSPSSPAVNTPRLPITAPVKPRTSEVEDSRSIQRISDVHCGIREVPYEERISTGNQIIRNASNFCEKINKIGEIEMGTRRTTNEKLEQKKQAIQILSNSWKEKQSFFEYIKQVPSIQNNDCRLSVNKRDDSFIIVAEKKDAPEEKVVWTYEDLTEENRKLIMESPKDAAIQLLDTFANNLNKQKEGVKKMTDINKKAGATTVQETPDQVQEKQLDRSDLYHARQNEDKHEITQKQLEALRKGEKDYVTEKQLDDAELKQHPRDNNPPDVVQEAQMTGDNRLGVDKHEITQKQLSNEGQRVENEQDVITEKQLSNISAPWARTAGRDASLFKSASDHMNSVLDVIADSVIKSGCTSEEACTVAASLVDSVKNRYNLATSILEDNKPSEEIDYAKRVAFWQNKNLKVASAGTKEIAAMIVDGLRTYASDSTYNPDVLIDAIDVVSEGQDGINSISSKVEAKLAASKKEVPVKKNRKEELRNVLKPTAAKTTKAERDEERKSLIAASTKDEGSNILNPSKIGNADTVIEASFGELGCKRNSPDFKKEIVAFTKGALASQNLRLASITNVTINGDTIQIAVQTGTEENEVNIDTGDGSTEIPVGGEEPIAPEGAETMPEGDLTGEGLEGGMGSTPPPAPAAGGAWASKKNQMQKTASGKITKKAQSPMGGGMPGAGGGVSAPGAPEQGLPGGAPGADPIQALTTDTGEEDDIPSSGDKMMPWTICPECGSSDTDVTNEGGDIKGTCNACTAEYEALIKKEVEFKIIKPTKSTGEEGVSTPEAPEAPEVPALPVAAQTRIDNGSIVRIASNREKFGHVCPACGTQNCKASKDADGHVEYSCPSCGTPVEKDVMVSASNPRLGMLRVTWSIFPNTDGCKGCKEAAKKFASDVKVAKMLKTAADNAGSFPMSSCLERIARQYGGDTVATFGPCKGKLLAECACKELQALGFRKVRHLNKFASISLEKDPWDECIEDQTKKEGHDLKEAESICGCIEKRFASDWMKNVYAQAFGEDVESGIEKDLNPEDLITLDKVMKEKKQAEVAASLKKLADAEDVDIGSELPALEEVKIEAEVVADLKKEAKGFFCDECKNPTKSCKCDKDGGDDKDDKKTEKKKVEEKEASSSKEIKQATKNKASEVAAKEEVSEDDNKKEAMSMNSKRVRQSSEEVLKMASTPKQVESIEGNVAAGVPRSKGTIRNEGADNIDVPMAKPSIPRGNAEMGHEGADNINPKAGLPDVAVDSGYMGHEKEIQKNMPAINNEIKGTVIADSVELTIKDGKISHIAKKLKEVDSVEGDVKAGVPRSKATIGNEGADNIDVPMAKPSIPRGNAEMGNEGADNINPKADGPDVPMADAYMGHEKDAQKGMPANNDEMLKQVATKRQVQLDKIAQSRKNEAVQTTAWLVANRRVAADKETFDAVVTALSAFESDQISVMAQRMFPDRQVKTASSGNKVETGYSVPAIVLESKPISVQNDDFMTKLANSFTIGSKDFDKNLTIYGEK